MVAAISVGGICKSAPPTKWIAIPGNGYSALEAGRGLDVPGRPSSAAEHQYGDWSRGWVHYAGGGESALDAQHGIFHQSSSLYYAPDILENAFPLNLGLLESTQPGDFMPVGSSLSEHTLALVPTRLANSSTGWNGLSRPTIGQRVDLITGVPLAQFEDLSLPFGGSSFRLIRTRSADRHLSYRPPDNSPVHRSHSETRWWDWVGSGWMMSENPILLIDSTMADEVGRKGTPRCTLWLDAFHSIPFDWLKSAGGVPNEQNGFYETSPRFRAKMIASRQTESGRKTSIDLGGPVRQSSTASDADPHAGQWLRYPDRFEVSLFEGEITYEFTPVWQDTPSWQYEWKWVNGVHTSTVLTNLHERPMLPLGKDGDDDEAGAGVGLWEAKLALKSPWESLPIKSTGEIPPYEPAGPIANGRGLGMPHYALVTAIRDKFGNRAEFKYTPLAEWNVPTPQAPEGGAVQNTSQKGQLREVRLKTSDGQTRWTLLYTYRLVPRIGPFMALEDWKSWETLAPELRRAWSDPALDTIYVYDGDMPTGNVTLLRSPQDAFSDDPVAIAREKLNHTPTNDMIESYIAGALPDMMYWPDTQIPLPSATEKANLRNWKYRCRYYYAVSKPSADHLDRESAIESTPKLVRSQVETRNAGGSPGTYSTNAPGRNHVFVYSGTPYHVYTKWLAMMFDDAAIARAAKAIAKHAASPPVIASHEDEIRAILSLPLNFETTSSDWDLLDSALEDLRESSTLTFRNAHDDTDTSVSYSGDQGDFGQPQRVQVQSDELLPGDPGNWFYDSCRGTVGAVSIANGGGDRSYFRFTRFVALPGAKEGSDIHIDWNLPGAGVGPMRSVFHSPYYWQAYPLSTRYLRPEFPLAWDGGGTTGISGSVPACPTEYTEARWVVFVDEFPTYKALRDGRPMPITGGQRTFNSFVSGSTRRDIYGINPQGNVLWKKSFHLRGNRFTESGDMGLTEHWVYKTGAELLQSLGKDATTINASPKSFQIERFLVAKKSVGYAAAAIEAQAGAPNAVPTKKGLIHVFEYGDVVAPEVPLTSSPEAIGYSWGERIKPIATGISNGDQQPGTSGPATVFYQSRTFYDPNDPTLVTASAQFTSPVTQLPATPSESGAILSRVMTTKLKDEETGCYTCIRSQSVSPPHCTHPDQPESKYYDISFDIAGKDGLTVWSVSATLPHYDSFDHATDDPYVRVHLTYFEYDGRGRPLKIWSDVDPHSQSNHGPIVPADVLALLPNGLQRVGGGANPQELLTSYVYDGDVVRETHFPNGRVFARRQFSVPDENPQINGGRNLTRVFRLNDLEWSSGTIYNSRSLCTIEDYGQFEAEYSEVVPFATGSGTMAFPFGASNKRLENRLIRTRQIWLDSEIDLESADAYENFTVKPPTEFSYDSAGRLINAKSQDLDWNGDTAAFADIVNNGDRVRIKEMDGNTKMQIRNAMGQMVRTYVGTDAFSWDDAWHAPDRLTSDMMLRERTEFGKESTNATLPYKVWHYLDTPSRGWTTANLDPFGPAPTFDPEGELTRTRFDWRMRPVRVDLLGPIAIDVWGRSAEGTEPEPEPDQDPEDQRPRLSTRLTYLDHADRPYIEASFGSEQHNSNWFDSIDPSKFVPSSGDPNPSVSISSILAKNPSSLVQTFYYDDGSVKERRTYRTRSSDPNGYQGSSDYTAERFGYGAGGREVFAQRPGGTAGGAPIQVTVTDNLGRTLQEKSVLPRTVGSGGSATLDTTYELTRTDYGYDKDSNVILTARWERIMPNGGSSVAPATGGTASLNAQNAVCTLTENWYDSAKRLLATADYGSGSTSAASSGTFVTPPSAATLESRLAIRVPVSNNGNPAGPELKVRGVENAADWHVTRAGVPANVPLTVHFYDRAGNKVGTATQKNFGVSENDVQYVFTRMEYDAKGRLFVQTDDETGIKRQTKYGYWLGRTVSICSPTTSASASWQTQGAIYGAEVVAESIDENDGYPTMHWVSRNNALVGAMLSTDPGKHVGTGSMEPIVLPNHPAVPSVSGLFPDVIAGMNEFQYDRPDFAYRYYADGQIAERVDRRRIAMRYFYDDHRRLKEVEVWHYPINALPSTVYPETPTTTGVVIKCAQNIYPVELAERGYPPFIAPFYDTLHPEVVPPTPTNRVGFILYQYDNRGNTTRVTALTARSADIITDTLYTYDERSNLIKEYQAHGSMVDQASTPFISYTREYASATSSASGGERLASMQYPAFAVPGNTALALSGSQVVTFDYGASGSSDAACSRIASIKMGSMHVAGFGYTGSGRRASLNMGGSASSPAIWNNFGGSSGSVNSLPGLDSFGRVRDLHYANTAVAPANFTLWRGQYDYDASGNRLFERLTQRLSTAATWGSGSSSLLQPSQAGSNTRSRQFSYDKLERLIASHSGTLDTSNIAIPGSASYPSVRSERWNLDKLGNWSGDGAIDSPRKDPCVYLPTVIPGGGSGGEHGPGVDIDGCPTCLQTPLPDGDGPFNPGHSVILGEESSNPTSLVQEFHITESGSHGDSAAAALKSHQPNALKTILNVNGGERAWRKQFTDPCGNLTFDGEFFYQYDAWNRVVQINKSGNLTWWRFSDWGVPSVVDTSGTLPSSCAYPAALGELVKHFTYDGVGRLARTSSPVLAPEGWHFTGNEGGTAGTFTSFTRSERFIYDGVRRIQEIITDPILADDEGSRVATMSFESEQRNGGHDGSGQSGELPNVNIFLRAQYIWGPGDNGVDELLCQIDPYAEENHAGAGGPQGKPWFILTDAQGDVASIVGVTNYFSGPIATVAGQWTYSPYGEVLTYDRLTDHPAVVFGHKTLAIDRLDGPPLTWENESEPGAGDGTLFETRRLEPGTDLLVYARNRSMRPKFGRWMQSDPNASGGICLQAPICMGGRFTPLANNENFENRFMDGQNLMCLGGSPIRFDDPLGLFSSGELLGSMGIQGLIGGMVNGALTRSWSGAAVGFAGGALSGGFGASVSAIGFLAKFGTAAGQFAGGSLFGGIVSFSQGKTIGMAALQGIAMGAIAGAVGGIADSFLSSVLTPAAGRVAQVVTNRLNGNAAVEDFIRLAQANGMTIIGREVQVMTTLGKRVIDVVIKNPKTGLLEGIEIKSSMSALNRFDLAAKIQILKDRCINWFGADAIGEYAGLRIDSTTRLLWPAP